MSAQCLVLGSLLLTAIVNPASANKYRWANMELICLSMDSVVIESDINPAKSVDTRTKPKGGTDVLKGNAKSVRNRVDRNRGGVPQLTVIIDLDPKKRWNQPSKPVFVDPKPIRNLHMVPLIPWRDSFEDNDVRTDVDRPKHDDRDPWFDPDRAERPLPSKRPRSTNSTRRRDIEQRIINGPDHPNRR